MKVSTGMGRETKKGTVGGGQEALSRGLGGVVEDMRVKGMWGRTKQSKPATLCADLFLVFVHGWFACMCVWIQCPQRTNEGIRSLELE